MLKEGIREYCEVLIKTYLIVYRVIDNKVYVLLIVDGHRDMHLLLQRRLLDA